MSPSDDGRLFVWEYASGRLAAVLPPGGAGAGELTLSAAGGGDGPAAGGAAGGLLGAACVAPHPLLPVLASGGADSVVRLWSPEAAQACSAQHVAEVAQENLQRLGEAGMAPAAADGLLAGGGEAHEHCITM